MNTPRMKRLFHSIYLCLLLVVESPQISANAILSYASSPTSWVGGGESIYLTDADPFYFIVGRTYDHGISIMVNDYQHNSISHLQRDWFLLFSDPYNLPLELGHYDDVARHPFNPIGTPGMDIFGNGRGNNIIGGFFEVLEVEYGQRSGIFDLPEIEKLAIDFTMLDESDSSKWMVGSFRFNSAIPTLSIPEPPMLGLMGFVLAIAVLRGSRSNSRMSAAG